MTFQGLINRVTERRSQDSDNGRLERVLVQRNRPLKATSECVALQEHADCRISISLSHDESAAHCYRLFFSWSLDRP